MSNARTSDWKPVAVAFTAVVGINLIGALATDIGPWYYALEKPSWQPPDWLFGPAWTLIFLLTAVSGVIAWRRAPGPIARRQLLMLFAINLVLNAAWSFLFFHFQRPDHALVEVVLLWMSIAVLMFALWGYARTASLLLLPYLAWVSFASYLNLTIVRLNAPFAGT